MATDDNARDARTLTWSQSNGYKPLPGPLALEELSAEARRRLWDLFWETFRSGLGHHPAMRWELYRDFFGATLDLWQKVRSRSVNETTLKLVRDGILKEEWPFDKMFDFLQMVMRHPDCPSVFIDGVKEVFERCQLAYYVDTGEPPTIISSTTKQEGESIANAIRALGDNGFAEQANALRRAGELINQSDWSGSIRESVGAFEAVARRLAPSRPKEVSRALSELREALSIHPALTTAMSNFYGYASAEQGLRHGKVDDSSSSVVGRDEAVLMLGMCASAAGYLLNKSRSSE